MSKSRANAIPGGGPMPLDRAKNASQTASLRGGLTHRTTIHPYDGTDPDSAASASGTSIFDPVLCELAYRWFCPPAGLVLDPFAGGSVRGIVAAKLGRRYLGVDLQARQVEANRRQWAAMSSAPLAEEPTPDPLALTPVQYREGFYFKRDDLFGVNGVQGGKVRTCLALARRGIAEGRGGLVTAGSRSSPQVNIVAHVAAFLGVPARCHTPEGDLSPEVEAAAAAGAEIVQHKAGYNNVIIARARADAEDRGWEEIPFGMECREAVAQTRRQVANLPAEVERIVIPCGSGMSLAGVLWGLRDMGREDVAVVAVQVGADPEKRLDEYAPGNWRERVRLVPSGTDYHEPAPADRFAGIPLDVHYEAKCIPFLAAGDLLWVVGIRQTAAPQPAPAGPDPEWQVGDSEDVLAGLDMEADFVFSCPPYGDLEVYSEDAADLSNMDYDVFLAKYRRIIAAAAGRLKEDRFACFVVGDFRDKAGMYRGFPWHTIAAFQDAGLHLYNEAVLVTAIGSLPIRAGRVFQAARKLGKTHQNVLVFVKGDPRRATEAIGEVEVGDVAGMEAGVL